MLPQTDFRPQIHGFDFNNHWDTDDNYRNFIKEKLRDAVPIVVKIVVTNPAFGGALLAAMGAAAVAGELLIGPLFETVAIPAIINQITGEVEDNVDDFIPDSYGACGGMAFASLDYYYRQWVIPKGNNADPRNPDKEFIVPSKAPGIDQTLRNFIYDRLKDTYDKGGVMYKMLEWFIILNTLPSAIGGGPEIQKRSKDEWVKLTGLLDQRKPQPICIQFDTWDIFDNHQVVAYGYGGDPFSGHAFINIYDNRYPNVEIAILFTFINDQMEGVLTHTEQLFFNAAGLLTDNMLNPIDPIAIQLWNDKKIVKGFFCTDYVPVNPPIGWGLQSGLTVHPSLALSTNADFSISGKAANAINFFPNEPQKTRLTPLVEELLNLTTLPVNNPVAAFGKVDAAFAVTKSFNREGDFILFAKAHVFVLEDDGMTMAKDKSGQLLSRVLYLPAHNAVAQASVHVKVIPKLTIIPYNRSGVSCYFPFVEGQHVTLMADKNPFPGDPCEYRWSVDGTATGNATHEKIELFNLPAADSIVEVKVQIRNMNTGAIASGGKSITIYSAEQSQVFATGCELSQHIYRIMDPRLFNPLGPDDPDFRQYIDQHHRQIGARAKEIVLLVNRLQGLHDREIGH